jgi:ACR3 family arsenite efflux pump ArsB
MILLPVYLGLFLGESAAGLVQLEPFVHAFVWLIAIPLVLAAAFQLGATNSPRIDRVVQQLGLLPVPSTALVLFLVFASVVPQMGLALDSALRAVPIYVTFACLAPLLGWAVARFLSLDVPAGRAIAFSAATRNSLVVLPLALAVPNAMPVLPAVIVAQTVVELISSLLYIRLIPKLTKVSA